MTLKEAREEFRANKCSWTALRYIETVKQYKANNWIGRATELEVKEELENWLENGWTK